MFREHSSVADLHPATELQAMMKFITSTYDRRMLSIVTSNFPMLAENGILSRLEKIDPVGRTLSRAKELFAQSGEIYLPGEDFRSVLAKRRGADPFAL